MRHGLLALLAILGLASLCVCRPSRCFASAADLWPVEATVRKADADWAVAANSASVDAWLAFYGNDAIVRLPNDTLASGKELLRHTVAHLLGLPHVSVAWRPIQVEVALSGDRALLLDSFELHFSDSGGAPVSDRGRRLEIWKKQPDGAWKCIVDVWNLDEVAAAAAAAPAVAVPSAAGSVAAPAGPTSPQGAPTAAGSPALAQSVPSPAAIPETGPPKPAPPTKYGEMPSYYEDTIRKYFLKHLKYPDSIQYREITKPQQGYTTAITGTLLMRETRTYGWTVKATINAKNSPDTFVGFKTYTFLFRGEKIVDARLPLPAGELAEPTPD